MKNNDIIVHPSNDHEMKAVKAFMQALNISYDVSEYDPEFVAGIKESRKQVKEGAITRVEKEDLKEFLGL